MPLGKVFGKIFTIGGGKVAKKGVGEAAQKGAKEVVTEGATKTVTEGTTDIATKTVAKTVAETTQSSVAKTISFTTKEVAVPLIKAVGPSAALAGVGVYIVNSFGSYMADTIEEIKDLLCDSEDNSDTCETIVNSAIGLGGIALVGGVVVLGLLVTRR